MESQQTLAINTNNAYFYPKKRQKQHISDIPISRPLVNLSKNEQIRAIKRQIQKLRTQSPHLIMLSPQNHRSYSYLNDISKSKIKKREDLSKIVIARLKRQKSKEYLRKLKKSQNFLPKLDMQGKSCWLPHKGRYINSPPPKDEPDMFPMNSVVKIKQRLKKRSKNVKIEFSQVRNELKMDLSVCGWQKSFNPEDITELLQ